MEEKVLIIDDDQRLIDLLKEYLGSFGYEVLGLNEGSRAMEEIREWNPELVVLDIMLPGKDGFEILKEIRRDGTIPVIMLTARGDDADRIIGLEMGADDYLPKPFNPRELLARIKAVLRRYTQPEPDNAGKGGGSRLAAGGLVLNRSRYTVSFDTFEEELSSTEFRILEFLMENPGKPVSRDEIMNRVRGREHMAFDRSIDVHISKIRSRLDKSPEHKNRIRTVWGTGYMFVEE